MAATTGRLLEVDADGLGAWFEGDMGGLWRYDDLVAWDATGRNVPVRLLSQGDGLIVQADTRGASWPVTVEPALTPVLSIETPLTASDGTADDNDCDDVIDPEDSEDATIWYADVDDDGYGAADSAVYACDPPDDTVSDGTDCDDTDPAVAEHPAAAPGPRAEAPSQSCWACWACWACGAEPTSLHRCGLFGLVGRDGDAVGHHVLELRPRGDGLSGRGQTCRPWGVHCGPWRR